MGGCDRQSAHLKSGVPKSMGTGSSSSPMPKSKLKSKKSKNSKQQSQTPTLSLKEQLAQKRKAQQARKEFTQFAFASVGIAAVLAIFLFLAAGPKAALAAVAIPALGFSYKYPRKALWAFLLYLPINGTVTYWIGGGNVVFQLAKDGIYIPALIALVKDCQRKKLPILISKEIKPSLYILLAFSGLTLLLVNGFLQFSGGRSGQPFLQGILGFKVFLGYIPLAFCAYYLIRTKKELLFLTRMHLVLAIICCILGFIQYSMLTSGRCAGTRGLVADALFKATLDAKCFVGGALVYSPEVGMIRLPGTFVSPWHWAWFLISNAFFTFATAFCDTSFLWRIGGLVGMALVFANAVISGQRIALSLVPVVFVLLLVLTGQVANLKRFIPVGVGLGVVLSIAAAANPALIQERIDSFVGRWNASPPQAFIVDQFNWAMKKQRGFLGRGLGTATNSTRIFGDAALVETYYPKVLYEIGPLGTLAFLVFVTCLTAITFKIYRSVKDKSLRSFGACFWVLVLVLSYNTYWYPLDTEVAIYYWFFAGVIFKLPEIDKQEQEKRLAEEENEAQTKKKGRRKSSGKRTVGKTSPIPAT